MKVNTIVHETKTVTKSVSLSTGGFVEIELAEDGTGYLKVHLSKNDRDYMDVNKAWCWIKFDKDKKNKALLLELRNALDTLIENVS